MLVEKEKNSIFPGHRGQGDLPSQLASVWSSADSHRRADSPNTAPRGAQDPVVVGGKGRHSRRELVAISPPSHVIASRGQLA